jgi:5'-nucleotidase/UDP-sugar diphosphatase
MRYVLATALLGALVCEGCEKPKAPQTTQEAQPTKTAGGVRPLEALEPPGTEPAEPPEPETTRFYVVRKGDTLWRIATRLYGDGQRYRDILAANPGLVPTRMQVGQKLLIPRD